ncbi:M28 family peptidase [Hymenobacter tibetensis]|uniref:M28 family peptidase n=1 Tax=Hymenobacter tibetensis TaxID=497967 RepID=A0ABY4CWT4_9BACT|nr:M28 family peptidase [Hymenobacter tibetensis]UOG74512.1 M28 family peptidase [Hymenobacter tibetensis]
MPRVRRTIQDLTAPAMQGRGYVRGGDQKAAEYIRRRFRLIGLQPLAPNYTQSFPLDVNTFPGKLKLRLRTGSTRSLPLLGGYHKLRPGFDFIAAASSGGGQVGGTLSAAAITPFDTLLFSDPRAQLRFLQTPWQGKGVVRSVRDARRFNKLPPAVLQHLDSAAFLLTTVPKLTASLSAQQSRQVQLEVLDSVWRKCSVDGKEPAFATLRVQAELKRRYHTQNIIGYVRGKAQPDSFLIVTAHYDHLGTMGHRTYFPGANDNASGTAMMLELASYYARPENQPAYSIAFIAFGAEEAGLVGSQYFVEHPLLPLSHIRFLVNLDLLGTGAEGATVVNGRDLPVQFKLLQRLNEQSRAIPSVAARGRAANSDHFPFSERGVPAFFLYTRGGITAYHDVQDRAVTLPLTAFTGMFALIRDFLETLSVSHP